MKRIHNKGNLPQHLKILASKLGGNLSKAADSEFYEAKTIEEFEKGAHEIGYEIVPTIDSSTGRGFLVGFDVTEPQRIITLVDYSALKIYFKECTSKELKDWLLKIESHRNDQQIDMANRREKARIKRELNPIKTTKE